MTRPADPGRIAPIRFNPLHPENPVGLALPPTIWAGHFLIVYVVTAIACEKRVHDAAPLGVPLLPAAVTLVTVAALAGIAGLILLSWRRFRPVRDAGHLVQERDIARSAPARHRFLALTTLLLGLLSAVATLMVALPAYWVPACL